MKWLACEGPSNSIPLTTYEECRASKSFADCRGRHLLGGHWEKPLSKWEGRRDGVLDLIGKATPGTFQPSLQIDGTGAKLLIEALSGRWSYDTERREKRTVWYHVANAFSLLISTISNYDRLTDNASPKFRPKTVSKPLIAQKFENLSQVRTLEAVR